MTVATTLSGPDDLPRRRRQNVSRLPDWSDPAQVRSWVFHPVPIPHRCAVDMETVERVYQWMLQNGWGRTDARS